MADRIDRASKKIVKALEVLNIVTPLAAKHEVIWQGQVVDVQATIIDASQALQTLARLARTAKAEAI